MYTYLISNVYSDLVGVYMDCYDKKWKNVRMEEKVYDGLVRLKNNPFKDYHYWKQISFSDLILNLIVFYESNKEKVDKWTNDQKQDKDL